MSFVLDASITASWFLEESDADAPAIAWQKVRTETALVPSIWWYEVRNALLIAERKKRISADNVDDACRELGRLRIEINPETDDREIMTLARRHGLTIYDAAYVQLAARVGCPLATFDGAMTRAARAEGIPLVGETEP